MAAFGALSSLGIGSGVLNYDVIDKLKKADESRIVGPVNRKLDLINKQQNTLSAITTATAGLKSAMLDLADGAIFDKRSAETVGESVSVEVKDGVAPQEIEMNVQQLARKDIWESKGFSSEDASVTSRDTTMTISVDGSDYKLDVEAGTTLSQLVSMINEKTAGKVVASQLNIGGSDPYALILKSAETGADQAITVTYDDGDSGTSDDDFLSLSNVQTAKNAKVVYNGVTIERSSNTIDDLIVGATFKLQKEGETTNISITQDADSIADGIASFVDAYNSWFSTIDGATKYNPDTKTAGVFQGDNSLNALKSSITRALTSTDVNGNGLASYGLDITKDGIVTFDKNEFLEALAENPDSVKQVLAGDDEQDGIFTTINDTLSDATKSGTGTLAVLDDMLKSQEELLEKEKERNTDFLDTKYEMMAQRFAAYDAQISRLNSSFQSLQQMIDAQINSKK